MLLMTPLLPAAPPSEPPPAPLPVPVPAPIPAPVTADPSLIRLARGGSRWAQAGLVLLVIGLIAGASAYLFARPGLAKGGGRTVTIAGAGQPKLLLPYARGELTVVGKTDQGVTFLSKGSGPPTARLIVTRMTLPAYSGSPTGAMPLAVPAMKAAIAARWQRITFLDETLANVGSEPGYQLTYNAMQNGNTWFGRATLVLPDQDGARHAALLDGAQRTGGKQVVNALGVGRQGALMRPMRNFSIAGN